MAEGSYTPSRDRVSSAIGLFVLGFFIAAGLLHVSIGDPLTLHADARSEKLVLLNRSRGSATSAVFGASFVEDGLDPRVFDREFDSSAVQTRTLNLAIEGGNQGEQRALALNFVKNLKTPPAPQPCLVVLDLDAMANMAVEHLLHPRTINIYDWPTAHFIAHLTVPQMSLSQRARRAGLAYLSMAIFYANTGMLSSRIFSPPIDAAELEMVTGEDRRGFHSLALVGTAHDFTDLHAQIAARPKQPAIAPGELLPGNVELLSQLVAAAPQARLSLVYLAMPRMSDLVSAPDYPDHLSIDGQIVPIINLARPDRFPDLYNADYWHDDEHLNGRGAEMVTVVFADQLKAWYQAHGGMEACAASKPALRTIGGS
jgi:hypothetical protein